MSHTVVRGKPNASQLYLDSVLDAILLEQGIKPNAEQRDNVTLSQILLYSLKQRPKEVFMINAGTEEVITNEQLLKRAVSLARSLTALGGKGKYAFMLMRNHQEMAVIYFAVMFAGVIPFLVEPTSTVFELTHFLKLVEPSFVFYDEEFEPPMLEATRACPELLSTLISADRPGVIDNFIRGQPDDVASFQVSEASMDGPVMLLPTSGSTGLPKATIMTHRGLVAQLPSPWSYQTQFPTPTGLMMILTTIQWMTFTMYTTASTVYHTPILMSSKKITAEHVAEMIDKYRPTFTFFSPAFAASLLPLVTSEQLSSFKTVILLGSPVTEQQMKALQEKLPKTAHLCDGYGTTETQGYIAIPDTEAPLKCNGWVFNFLYYKIVDEEGQELGLKQSGELWVKGVSVLKGYHKNVAAYEETVTPDGWYKTGDVFYVDENERVSFVVRKKFNFKYKGFQVAPEEVERIICTVPGVQESVVCNSDSGPVAAVVLRPGADVTRDRIHTAVNSTLSEHKRLHGGLAFVPSLPHTPTGKLKRNECSQLMTRLMKTGQCC